MKIGARIIKREQIIQIKLSKSNNLISKSLEKRMSIQDLSLPTRSKISKARLAIGKNTLN